ncbi:hypothetical protein ACHAWT_003388 [Skeletonema menzelii]
MKLIKLLSTVSLLSIAGVSGAGAGAPAAASTRPQLSITIRDGNFTDFDGLEPTITWENSQQLPQEVDLRYGIDLSAKTTNLASLPRRIWGRASRKFVADRFSLSTRLDMDVQRMDRVAFQIDAADNDNDLKLTMFGSAAASLKRFATSPRVSHIEFTKGFDNDGNRITVNPRYNVDYDHMDVVMTYDADDTLISVTASKDDQVVTISQQLNDENMISPTISRDGSLTLAWDRKLGDHNSVRTTLNPNRSVEVEWKDEAWTANVNFPMEEDSMKGATVHIKRDVRF